MKDERQHPDRLCETLGKHASALSTVEGERPYIALPALPADHQREMGIIPRR